MESSQSPQPPEPPSSSPTSSPLAGVGSFTLRPAMDAIGRGEVFRTVVSAVLQLVALVLLAVGIVWLLRLTWDGFRSEPTFTVGVGIILALLFGIVLLVLVSHIIWLRGTDIRKLPTSEFTAIPIASMLFRLYGEIMLVAALIMGVLAMLLIWLGVADDLLWRLGMLRQVIELPAWFENRFLLGITSWLTTWLWGFIILVVAYIVAELVMVLFAIARNTARTADAMQQR